MLHSTGRCDEFATSAVVGPGQSDLHCILYWLGKKDSRHPLYWTQTLWWRQLYV